MQNLLMWISELWRYIQMSGLFPSQDSRVRLICISDNRENITPCLTNQLKQSSLSKNVILFPSFEVPLQCHFVYIRHSDWCLLLHRKEFKLIPESAFYGIINRRKPIHEHSYGLKLGEWEECPLKYFYKSLGESCLLIRLVS